MMKENIQAIADAFGDGRITNAMRLALMRDLALDDGGAAATAAFFGTDLPTIQGLIAPAVLALDEMLPGFRGWLERSGHGDDRYMIVALLAIVDRLERMGAPTAKRRLPHGIDRPVVLS